MLNLKCRLTKMKPLYSSTLWIPQDSNEAAFLKEFKGASLFGDTIASRYSR